MTHAAAIVLFALLPAGIIWLAHHQHWARKLGVVVLCYLAGLILGNSGLLPRTLLPLQTQVTDLSVALAMPLLLFSLDIRQWRKVAGKALISMLLASTAVVTLATCLFFFFDSQGVRSADHFAAMSVGVYTGGTPNLAAIKSGLDIPHSEYVVFHSLDTLLGSLYLLSMLTIGIPLFRKLLPAPGAEAAVLATNILEDDNYAALLTKGKIPQIAAAVGLSALVVASAWLVATLFARLTGQSDSPAVMILMITSGGILLSLHQSVRGLHTSYPLGMYLIYIFCFAVASMADLNQLAEVDWRVMGFLLATILGSLVLHCGLCRLFGVDSDTFMVTSVAAVCSPPFVPMMARALNNPGMLLSGMTTGIIGYAFGNYLGITLGLLLQRF